jgi:hypothetical protein
VRTKIDLPKQLQDLSYDQYRDIRFKRERALWTSEGLPFLVELLPPGLHFQSFEAAPSTRVGLELLYLLHKGQREDEVEPGPTAAEQFYALAPSSTRRPRQLTSHRLHTKICDRTLQ